MALNEELVGCLQWYFTHAEGQGIEERKQDSQRNRLMAKQLGQFIRELDIPGTFAVGPKHNIDEDYENELVGRGELSPNIMDIRHNRVMSARASQFRRNQRQENQDKKKVIVDAADLRSYTSYVLLLLKTHKEDLERELNFDADLINVSMIKAKIKEADAGSVSTAMSRKLFGDFITPHINRYKKGFERKKIDMLPPPDFSGEAELPDVQPTASPEQETAKEKFRQSLRAYIERREDEGGKYFGFSWYNELRGKPSKEDKIGAALAAIRWTFPQTETTLTADELKALRDERLSKVVDNYESDPHGVKLPTIKLSPN